VRRAENGNGSSARHWLAGDGLEFLAAGPVRRAKDWLTWVNQAITPAELEALRRCINRGSPFGSEGWVLKTAADLGLESTPRPRGRPKKETEERRNEK
jgi:putative transposase